MTAELERVVVVGASLAGLRAAETLRNEGFDGEVVVIGAEPHRPYDRPPLSKKLLAGEWEPDRIQLRQAGAFDELDVSWRLGVAAAGLDLDERRLHLTDGETVDFDGCIIATGALCRRLPEQSRYGHVHELRTLDDSMRLRTAIADGGHHVVVIGAGFIGLEVAATARQLGNEVTVLEGASAPLIRGLGAEMGAAIGAMHEARGVAVRCDVRVDRLHDDGVLLEGGELVESDVVVVGIGVTPATQWLGDSGLELRDGVVCDETLRARRDDGAAVPGVYAAGDVLRWMNPLFGEEMRIEHWTNAAEQGAVAARNVLAAAAGADAEEYGAVPFFWSDQFDIRIQFLGRADADDEVAVVAGSIDSGKFLAMYGRDGRLHGALGVNAPRWIMPIRKLLLAQASWDDALSHAATL
ncbi:MAG: NAD(P)/FAD-dependent oxidoreductase [Ilumatobacter sp.]|jgi:NADPH-dependent 2,4-dienoyl-CoA reductase/sulfur reductase-like enzyme|uniref:NAD(P)/FAD-dependent oxidoreductase n=1 Tax=Ilumatobacter sp. TaxID=1967498 RepID=UPI003919836E